MLISFGAVAQNDDKATKVVLYDPLFWRDHLSLKNDQYRRIERINYEFYEGLREVMKSPHAKSDLNNRLTEELRERSDKIWNTLYPKQRRKLERIIDKSQVAIKVTRI